MRRRPSAKLHGDSCSAAALDHTLLERPDPARIKILAPYRPPCRLNQLARIRRLTSELDEHLFRRCRLDERHRCRLAQPDRSIERT